MGFNARLRAVQIWFLNLSLITKMFFLFAIAGLIPLSTGFVLSYKEICQFSYNNQKNMTEQGYRQTHTALANQLDRIKKLSTLIAANQNFNSALKLIRDSSDSQEQYTEYKKLNKELSDQYFSTEYDSIMYYVSSDFNLDESMFPIFRSSEMEKGKEVIRELDKNGNKPVWMYYTENRTYNSGEYLSLARYISDMSDFSTYIGIVMINIEVSKIRDTFIPTRPEELIYLKTTDDRLITSSNDKMFKELGITAETESGITNSINEIAIGGKRYLALKSRIPDTNLQLIAVIPVNVIYQSLFHADKRMVAFYACICIIMLMIIFAITKSISKRILLLSRKMKGVREGTLDKLTLREQKDEVGNLVTNYNFMVDEIQSLLSQQFQLGQEKKGAELKALQSQINPHFLYNTLDMINWMAQRNETEHIRDTVYALSKYYRLILNKGEDIITIGDEIQICNAYISIQQKRFKDRIKFVVDMEEAILRYLIPKITLQPLIENAIIHGISENPDGCGTIIVSGWEEGDDELVLSVTDDGVGMNSAENFEPKPSGSRYGIRNIEMRLNMFYGKTQCIQYDSARGIGTCVSLNIRKIKQKGGGKPDALTNS